MSWNFPIPEQRWRGFRRRHKGIAAFESLAQFNEAALSELGSALEDHELVTLGRLLVRGKRPESEVFIRTHGPNPLFNPQDDLDIPVGVAKADVVDLNNDATAEANRAILDGEILHVLFQAGEASRFSAGPLYNLNPLLVAEQLSNEPDVSYYVKSLAQAKEELDPNVGTFLTETPLGPKQPLLLRAALRRVVQDEIAAGRLQPSEALARYRRALANQKILFFVSRRGDVNVSHDEALQKYGFFGFAPANLLTIEQELAQGIRADEGGQLSPLTDDAGMDAAGHLYALIQAARPGGFTTYTESGRRIKPMEVDAFSYCMTRGAKIMCVIRINDMDRHSTEIINAKALSYALRIFESGYVNAIETVANPDGQKGGTGTTFGDPDIHVLTETHENSFPTLSRAFDAALQGYLHESKGQHPAYNAMRQWADLVVTRQVLKEFGGRLVFVPRQKTVKGEDVFYLGVDMPMGDLSLLSTSYKSRMFQFVGPHGRELLIHDMKKQENISIALRTLLRQLEDPHVLAAAQEIKAGTFKAFTASTGGRPVYAAPCPEFDN